MAGRPTLTHCPSAVFAALAQDGAEHAGSKMALASLLKMMWGQEYVDERGARFINDRVHANIQRDGTFSVVPQIPGGVTTPAQLRRIADVAERYHIPMVKITVGQRIDLLGVRKEDLPDFAVGDEQVAVFRPRDGGLHALQAICPHRGGPLADGLIDGTLVVCPLHNHAFRLADGQCTTGEWSVQAYPVAVEDGEVVLRPAR